MSHTRWTLSTRQASCECTSAALGQALQFTAAHLYIECKYASTLHLPHIQSTARPRRKCQGASVRPHPQDPECLETLCILQQIADA